MAAGWAVAGIGAKWERGGAEGRARLLCGCPLGKHAQFRTLWVPLLLPPHCRYSCDGLCTVTGTRGVPSAGEAREAKKKTASFSPVIQRSLKRRECSALSKVWRRRRDPSCGGRSSTSSLRRITSSCRSPSWSAWDSRPTCSPRPRGASCAYETIASRLGSMQLPVVTEGRTELSVAEAAGLRPW